jgi:hypothetical protein
MKLGARRQQQTRGAEVGDRAGLHNVLLLDT